ncbi:MULTISPECIES: ATP-binding protein [unclassified Streptomyces]|uniref:ATP-binding protein n=1 Tax=unclassified Streptomyces TaxID=2593676 RepID=UPI0003693263|nr:MULTISPECIES: ATP-binding protein [unclassified Streptomyces]MYY06444.1 ATP-binding protein [Streptomyces sp. SID4913]
MTSVTVPSPPVPYLPQRGERYRLVAPNSPTAPRVARDFVGTLLRATEHPGLVDDARLCVSEVVSNAHCHTGSARIRVDVTVNRRQVMVYVTDDEPNRLPKPGTAPDAESGRGLLIVESLTDRWGTTTRGGRAGHAKTVWFVLLEPGPCAGGASRTTG